MNPQADIESTEMRSRVEEFDVVVIGAGNTGLYQLHLLKSMGLSVRVYDDAGEIGGTWYWNTYPGARFDSEAESYVYSFSPEIIQEWDWQERFPTQPENKRYLNYVADKLQLRGDIVLNTRVEQMVYDGDTSRWDIRLNDGSRVSAQFVSMAVGHLSAPYVPTITGQASFEGDSFHTARWPQHPVDLKGKRVAVIGTGSSGIQVIENIVDDVSQLTVYQRTPNYAVPLRNHSLSGEQRETFKTEAPEIHRSCREDAATGFIHIPDPRSGHEYTKEERLRLYDEWWERTGFGKYLAGFSDLMTDRELNAEYSEFVREKIRARVDDPEVAAKLLPKEPMGAKRVPCETGYYEAYNQDHVELVSTRETPIERITSKSIVTADGQERDFDIIVYATGFDGFNGSITNVDIRGLGGETIQEKMSNGWRTYLNLQTHGFPNLFFPVSFSLCNHTVCAEMLSEWVADCISYVLRSDGASIQPRKEAEDAWVEHVIDVARNEVMHETETNWFLGSNIPSKPTSVPLVYVQSVKEFRRELTEAAEDYSGFILEPAKNPSYVAR